mgnify:CR=1 FL=1
MLADEKIKIFEQELEYIQEPVKSVVINILSNLPDYFFKVAASSTGKYHPKMSLGEGGLVRHTKAAVRIAMDLLELQMFAPLDRTARDLILGSLLLHDGLKHGKTEEKYTRADHPLLMSEFILDLANKDVKTEEVQLIYERLASGIATHMGQWNIDYRTKQVIMEKPQTHYEKFIHLCDYLASRKYIDMEF